jgi:biotin transporter BioY
MTARKIIATIGFVLVTTTAVFAQSAYNTSDAAGLPVSSGYSSGRNLYAYVPGYEHRLYVERRRR